MPAHVTPAHPSPAHAPSGQALIRELKRLHRRLFELEKLESEHQHTIAQLTRERDFSRSLVEAFPVFFFLLGSDGTVKMMNGPMLKSLGYSRSQTAGRIFVEAFVPAQLRQEFQKNFKESLRSRRPYHIFCPVQPKRGEPVAVEWFFSPVFRADGELDYFFGVGTDVTQQQKAAQAIKASQQRLLDIINFLPDATFAIDKKGTVLAWNHAIEALTGVKARDMLGKGNYEYALPFYGQRRPILIDLVLRKHNQVEKKFYTMLRRENGTVVAETRFPRPQGKESILWGKASALYDNKGNKIGAIESIRDITQSKREHAILEESERKYRFLTEHLRDIVWTMDTRLRHTFVNPAITSVLGYSVEEALAIDMRKVWVYPSYSYLKKKLGDLFTQPAPAPGKEEPFFNEEVQVRHKDGSLRWLEVRFSLTRDTMGKVSGLQGTSRDVTERKRIETALRESEERYRRIVETASEGIWGMDRDYVTTFVNQKMADMLGYIAEEMIGKPVSDFVAPGDRDDHREKIALSIHGEGQRFERRFTHRDGSVRWMLVSATPLRGSTGGFSGAFAMLTDITERKRMEKTVESQRRTFEMFTEQSPLGLMMITRSGVITYLNGRFTEITGYSLADIPDGKSWFNRAYPDDRVRAQVIADWRRDTRAMRTGMKRVRVFPVSCRNGSRKIISFRTVAMEDGGWLVYCEDVTVLKLAQDALRLSEEKFSKAFHCSADAMTITSLATGRIIEANEASKKIFGYSRAEALGRTSLELGVWVDERDRQRLQQAIAGGGAAHMRVQQRRKSGEVFVAALSAELIQIEGESCLLTTVRDVTEIELAQQALRERENRLHSIFRAAPVGIGLAVRKVMLQVNDRFCEMTGYAPDEVIGRDLRMLYHSLEEYEHVDRVQYDRIRATGTGTVETRWMRKDGTVINVLLSAVPLDQSDWDKGVTFTALDITERVRTQEGMAAALKEKEILLKEINHRVKNNLQVVSSLINLQSKSIKDPEDRVMFKDCQSRIKSMVLIHEKLYYLQSLTKIDFTKYIHDLAAGLFASYVVDTKKIKFRINVVDNITLTVNHAIPCGLIVNELVSNALKHAFTDSREGDICIDFRQEPDTTYILTVEDNGRGLPQEIDLRTAQSLGLQIVLTLVEQLNGTIEVLRTRGTCFRIRFK